VDGIPRGTPVLVAEEYWTVTRDVVDWPDLPEQQFLVRIRVDGAPPLRLDLTIDNDPVDELAGSSGGQLAVAMTAVRPSPMCCKHPRASSRHRCSAPTTGAERHGEMAAAPRRSSVR